MTTPAAALSPIVLLGSVEDDIIEVVIYGGIFVVLVILLILVKIFYGVYAKRKVRNMRVPFGLAPEDLGMMKEKAGLTEEELKAVRASMARQMLERDKAEKEAARMPKKAEAILSMVEAEVLGGKPPARKPENPPAPLLPAHLQQFATMPDLELEQLHEAGFLDDESLGVLRRHRAKNE